MSLSHAEIEALADALLARRRKTSNKTKPAPIPLGDDERFDRTLRLHQDETLTAMKLGQLFRYMSYDTRMRLINSFVNKGRIRIVPSGERAKLFHIVKLTDEVIAIEKNIRDVEKSNIESESNKLELELKQIKSEILSLHDRIVAAIEYFENDVKPNHDGSTKTLDICIENFKAYCDILKEILNPQTTTRTPE